MSKSYTITCRVEQISFAAYTGELCWLDGIVDDAPEPMQAVISEGADITLDGHPIDQGEHDEARFDLLHWYLKQKEYGQACVELTYEGYGVKVARFFRAAVPPGLKQRDHGRRKPIDGGVRR